MPKTVKPSPRKTISKAKTFSNYFSRIRSRHPTHNILRRNKQLLFPFPSVIRFGSTTEIHDPNVKVEINTVEAISNCADKLRMKTLFKEGGIKSPAFFTLSEIKGKKLQFPLIKKLRFHSRGRGMEFIANQQELDQLLSKPLNNNVYFEEYFNGSREYRFHVNEDGCFYTCRKMRKAGAPDRWYFNSSNSVWILDNNQLYNKPKTYDKIIAECVKALKVLKMDFCAFDVRVKKDGSFQIIEGNSAPSFGELTTQRYLEMLPNLIKKKAKCAE